MEARHLELLRDLSVHGTISAVAAATHRTPSALSQQLRSIERDIGSPVVEPVGRGVRLTTAGRILADGADDVLAALAQVRARLDAATGEPTGTVSIGTLPSAGQALLPALLRRLDGTAITLDLDDFDLAEADYAARTLDVDIVIAHSLTGDIPAGAEGLRAQVLAREPIDVAVPATHPLAGRSSLRATDLAGSTWIGVPLGYPFDDILLTIEQRIDERLHRWVRLRDNRLIESLVSQGAGLALLPRFTSRPSPQMRLVPLEDIPAHRAIVALSRRDRYARLAVRTVVDLLQEVGAEVSRAASVDPESA